MLHKAQRIAAACLLLLIPITIGLERASCETLRIATYNVRNYLTMDRQLDGKFRMNYPKPEAEKSVVRESILVASPDLLALQEIGSAEMLEELRDDLEADGLNYSGSFILEAEDETRRIGALWKSTLSVNPVGHTDMDFPLFGSRERIKRGLLELKVETRSGQEFSVFNVHLKSRYTTDRRDLEAEMERSKEATAARDRILERYPDPAKSPFFVLGDLNDNLDSAAVRRFLSRGDLEISRVVDARDSRGLVWTHYFVKGGEYSLIDYILCSPSIEESKIAASGIVDVTHFDEGSDHRLVWVDFRLDAN